MASPSRDLDGDLDQNQKHGDFPEEALHSHVKAEAMNVQAHKKSSPNSPLKYNLHGISLQINNNTKTSSQQPNAPLVPESQLPDEPEGMDTQSYNEDSTPDPWKIDSNYLYNLLPSTEQSPHRHDTPPEEDWLDELKEAEETTTKIYQESGISSALGLEEPSSTRNNCGMEGGHQVSTTPSLEDRNVDYDLSISATDFSGASQPGQNKWSIFAASFGTSRKKKSISINNESIDSPPTVSPSPLSTQKSNLSALQLLTSQRQLLASYIQPQNDTLMGSNPADFDEDNHGAETSGRSGVPRNEPEVADYDSIDQAMGKKDEDAEWMENDTDHVEEYEKLVERVEHLERRQANGNITKVENGELTKAQREVKTWNKLVGSNEARDFLFVDDTPANKYRVPSNTLETLGAFRNDDHLPMDLDASSSDSEHHTRSKFSKTKKSKNGKSAKSKHTLKGKEKARGKGKLDHRAKGPAILMKGRQRKNVGKNFNPDRPFEGDLMSSVANHNSTNEMILSHLAHNNTIEDFHSNAARSHGNFPGINTRNKDTQLKEMFGAIPAGADDHTIKADRAKLNKASKTFGQAKVKAENGKWKVKGMDSALYHHQLLGAYWMVKREMSDEQPHGGLLADSMGLGKTVEAIACMVANPPQDADRQRGVKATLIVVPASVISQWHSEIETHTSRGTLDHIMVYKSSATASVQSLSAMDIILCSYQEIMKQFPFPDTHERAEMLQIGYKQWLKKARAKVGLLHQVEWYRIILDEAHFIKNHRSRTSMACQNISSIYRWCLTGTPLMNQIEEFYPYLRFLRANVGLDQQSFQRNFCNPKSPECRSRVNVILSYTMLRRTMRSTLLNRPLITLPEPTARIEYVQFSEEERVIYRITENRFRTILNSYIASGDLLRNYSIFFVQLLRLRQCTSHPFMLERTIKESWTLDDVKELRVKLRKIDSENFQPFYERTKLWVGSRVNNSSPLAGEDDASKDMGSEQHVTGDNRPFGRGDMGTLFNMDRVLGSLKKKDLAKRVHCGLCGDFPEDPTVIDCKHAFCRGCLEGHMHRQVADAFSDPIYTCPTCSQIFSDLLAMDTDSELDDDEGSTSAAQARRQKRIPANSKGRDHTGYEPYTEHSSWLQASDTENGSIPLTSSAKITALKALLLRAFEENPMEKVIVFVQFHALARIVGRLCNQEQWGFLYYTGDQTLQHRSKAIVDFKVHPDLRIMISGLKCGGIGLNLTMASRCVNLDLWWNHAVEQQAFGRIFRIGQERPTTMTRIVVENSVDMRMLSMQAHKLKDVDKTMADHRHGAGLLGIKELVGLFGFLRTDADGVILGIDSDYQDEGDDNSGA